MDIIWTCLFTIFICTYTVLCLNVPSENENAFRIFTRRLLCMSIGIIGPEFVLTYASGQWGTARESVQAFHELGYPQWTMRHAFFANMGGFLLVLTDSKPFRVTAKHLRYLVFNHYISYPEICTEELWDKSKQDTLAGLITCLQVFYLVLHFIGRAAQNLSITTMELLASVIVISSIMTSICWWSKPLDFRTPIGIPMEMSTSELLKQAGNTASKPYKQTPLDFIDDLGPTWILNVQAFYEYACVPSRATHPTLGK